MDGQRFDKLARLLANGSDRRGFLKRVAGVAAGAAIVTGPGRALAQNGAAAPIGYGEQCYLKDGDTCDTAKHLECVIPAEYDPKYGYTGYAPEYGYYDYGTQTYYPYGTCECTDTYTYNADKGYCWADDSACYANEDCNTEHYGDEDKYTYYNGYYYHKDDYGYETPLPVYECIYGVCVEVVEETPETPETPGNGGGNEESPIVKPPKNDKGAWMKKCIATRRRKIKASGRKVNTRQIRSACNVAYRKRTS